MNLSKPRSGQYKSEMKCEEELKQLYCRLEIMEGWTDDHAVCTLGIGNVDLIPPDCLQKVHPSHFVLFGEKVYDVETGWKSYNSRHQKKQQVSEEHSIENKSALLTKVFRFEVKHHLQYSIDYVSSWKRGYHSWPQVVFRHGSRHRRWQMARSWSGKILQLSQRSDQDQSILHFRLYMQLLP